MSEFTSILTHQRKLQGATNELTIEQLEDAQQKLGNIIAKRREKLESEQAAQQEKQQKAEALLKLLEEQGLSVEDLAGATSEQKSKTSGKRRPIKYRLTDDNGKEHTWTGIGRMPKVFKSVLDEGKQLEDYAA